MHVKHPREISLLDLWHDKIMRNLKLPVRVCGLQTILHILFQFPHYLSRAKDNSMLLPNYVKLIQLMKFMDMYYTIQ